MTVDYDNEEFVGPQLPTREIAFSNTFTLLGNLRIFAQFDYKGGHHQWCAICSIRNRIDRNSWEVNNPDADPVEVLVWRSRQTKTHLFPADFLKFREIALSYTLPANLSNAFRADRATVTLSAASSWPWNCSTSNPTSSMAARTSAGLASANTPTRSRCPRACSERRCASPRAKRRGLFGANISPTASTFRRIRTSKSSDRVIPQILILRAIVQRSVGAAAV